MKKIVFKSTSVEETEDFAEKFAEKLNAGDFIAFYGEMGSGKTAFVRGLARTFCKNSRVSSPTFAIVNEYIGKPSIFHFDMYRITDDDDLYSTGFYDYFEREGIIAVEWSENISFALPENYVKISFERGENENERILNVEFIGGEKHE